MCCLFIFAVSVASGCVICFASNPTRYTFPMLRTHTAEWRIMGITMNAFSIDAFDREIVAKWQYIVVRAVRQCFIWSFVLTDARFFAETDLFISVHSISLGVIVIVLFGFFFHSISWRLDNAEIRVRFLLMEHVPPCIRAWQKVAFITLLPLADAICNHSPVLPWMEFDEKISAKR